MCCSCGVYKKTEDYSFSKILNTHMFQSDFMPCYNCWNKQEKIGVIVELNEEEEDDDNYFRFPE
jgi:hypothetical protein